QSQTPIDGLTPRTAIQIAGRLRGLSRRDARRSAEDLAEELDIGPWLDRRALPEGAGLSGGIRRLTGFAMAVAAPAPLLILDEPTNDIDPSRRRLLWDALRRRADEGAGALLVTHNVAEAERIVDELVVLDRGRVVASGSPTRLRGTQDSDLRLELQPAPGVEDPSELATAPPVRRRTRTGRRTLLTIAADAAARAAASGSPPRPPGTQDSGLRLELQRAPGVEDPSEPATAPPVRRRTRTGRRTLLTIAADDAASAVAWATEQRARGLLEGFSLAPVTLEDAYLALASPGAGADSSRPVPADPTR